MYAYSFCGDVVHSSMALPELAPAPPSTANARTWRCEEGALPSVAEPAHHAWLDEAGEPWLRIGRAGGAFRLVFAPGVTFDVDHRSIRWQHESGVPADTIRHLLLDQVLPLAIGAHGGFVLHGAAVRLPAGAVAFVGPSGRGKSSLAAAVAHAGHPVLADDCVSLVRVAGRWHVMPAYEGVRLWPDAAARLVDAGVETRAVAHYTSKRRVPVASDASGPVPLAAIYLLDHAAGAEPALRAGTVASIIDVTRCTFRLDIGDRGALARDFDTAAGLIADGFVGHLAVPRGLTSLPATADFLVRHHLRTPE